MKRAAPHPLAGNTRDRPAAIAARALAILLLAIGHAGPGFAAPAPWYLWDSPRAARTICAQVSPGPAWVRVRGPFLDSRCEKRGRPGEALPGTLGTAPAVPLTTLPPPARS